MHCSPGQGVNPNTPHADTGHYCCVCVHSWGLRRTQNQGSLAAKNEQNLWKKWFDGCVIHSGICSGCSLAVYLETTTLFPSRLV